MESSIPSPNGSDLRSLSKQREKELRYVIHLSERKKHTPATAIDIWKSKIPPLVSKERCDKEELILGEIIHNCNIAEAKLIEKYIQENQLAHKLNRILEIKIRNLLKQRSDDILKFANTETKDLILTNTKENAALKLANTNIRFLISEASKFYSSHKNMDEAGIISLGDLINVGYIGLKKAAERYDYTRGVKFISYAKYWLDQSMIEFFLIHGKTVRQSNNFTQNSFTIISVRDLLLGRYNREPTLEEIFKFLKKRNKLKKYGGGLFNQEEIYAHLNMAGVNHISLDAKNEHDERNLYERILPSSILSPFESDEDSETKEKIAEIIRTFFIERYNHIVTTTLHGFSLKTKDKIENKTTSEQRKTKALEEEQIFHLYYQVSTPHFTANTDTKMTHENIEKVLMLQKGIQKMKGKKIRGERVRQIREKVAEEFFKYAKKHWLQKPKQFLN